MSNPFQSKLYMLVVPAVISAIICSYAFMPYAQAQPSVIDNSIIRVELDHGKGNITRLVFKPGSNRNLIDPYWGTHHDGLCRLPDEITTLVAWGSTEESITFEYSSSYGSKKLILDWSNGFELDIEWNLIHPVPTWYNCWEPGGNNMDGNDVFAVEDGSLPAGVYLGTYNYSGGWTLRWEGNTGFSAIRDLDYNEVFGYKFEQPMHVRHANGASVDHYIHELPAGLFKAKFAVKICNTANWWEPIRSLEIESENHPPSSYITTPSDGDIFGVCEPFDLAGYAEDLEDGILPSDNVSWYLDGNHIADAYAVNDFAIAGEGLHTIRFECFDSDGEHAYTEIEVEIRRYLVQGQVKLKNGSPIARAKVEIYEKSLLIDPLLGTVYTDDNGYYSLDVTNLGFACSRDRKFAVYASFENEVAQLYDGHSCISKLCTSRKLIKVRCPEKDNAYLDALVEHANPTFDSNDLNMDAFSVWHKLISAYNLVTQEWNYNGVSQIDVFLKADNVVNGLAGLYDPITNNIYYKSNVAPVHVYHEYGHYILDCVTTLTELSFNEGWAMFFERLFPPDNGYHTHIEAFPGNLYDSEYNMGQVVASIFFDLMDYNEDFDDSRHDDGIDPVDADSKSIFAVMRDHAVKDIWHFYKHYKDDNQNGSALNETMISRVFLGNGIVAGNARPLPPVPLFTNIEADNLGNFTIEWKDFENHHHNDCFGVWRYVVQEFDEHGNPIGKADTIKSVSGTKPAHSKLKNKKQMGEFTYKVKGAYIGLEWWNWNLYQDDLTEVWGDWSVPIKVKVGGRHAEESLASKVEFALHLNSPNPFNPTTTIFYSLAKEDYVKLEVFNTLGQKVKTLVNEYQGAGRYQVKWDGTDFSGRDVASGVYLYRLNSGVITDTKKMILLR